MATRKRQSESPLKKIPLRTSQWPPIASIAPPIEPMLAKLAEELPAGGTFLFEPKWDGFRALVFRGVADVFIQSRDLRPLDRYFPELHEALLEKLLDHCVTDGEIVIMTPSGLDFDQLQLNLHPAASLVARLIKGQTTVFSQQLLLSLIKLRHLHLRPA